MAHELDPKHPIRSYFGEALHRSLHEELGLPPTEDVDAYIVEMLVRFLSWDGLYAVRDAAGLKVQTVAAMLAEGDMQMNADSFVREREVHRHIGDFLLFWSGMFPEFIRDLRRSNSPDAILDIEGQARYSYHLVSTFDHPPYAAEAPVFRKLSAEFEAYQAGLRRIRTGLDGFGPWVDGFPA